RARRARALGDRKDRARSRSWGRALRRTRGTGTRRAAARPVDDAGRRRAARDHGTALRGAVRVPPPSAPARSRARLMPSWGAVAYGVVLSGVAAGAAAALLVDVYLY